jgi:hypothetical protein
VAAVGTGGAGAVNGDLRDRTAKMVNFAQTSERHGIAKVTALKEAQKSRNPSFTRTTGLKIEPRLFLKLQRNQN